jgi:hypothetical protein
VGLLTIGWEAAGSAALAAAVLVATNHLLLGYGLSIGSDLLSAGLTILGFLAVYLAVERAAPRWLYVGAAGLALSFLAQPSTPFLAPGLLLVLLYQPGARRGVGLAGLRRLVRTPATWGSLALAIGVTLGAVVFRRALVGEWWPRTGVYHRETMGLSLDRWTFYVWSSLAAWSIPVALLALLGTWHGLRRRATRRLALGLLGALAGPFAFFAFAYEWRDNRFVVYWTLPALLLAALGVAALGRRVRVPVLLLAAVAGNLTVNTGLAPGYDPVLTLWPGRSWTLEYVSTGVGSTIRPSSERARLFRRALSRWAGDRRRTFASRRGDDIYYSRTRELLGQLTTFHVQPSETLFYDPGPSEYHTYRYILKNQFALSARRRVAVVRLDPTLGSVPASAVVVLRTATLNGLRGAGLGSDRLALLDQRGAWALVRVATAGAAIAR